MFIQSSDELSQLSVPEQFRERFALNCAEMLKNKTHVGCLILRVALSGCREFHSSFAFGGGQHLLVDRAWSTNVISPSNSLLALESSICWEVARLILEGDRQKFLDLEASLSNGTIDVALIKGAADSVGEGFHRRIVQKSESSQDIAVLLDYYFATRKTAELMNLRKYGDCQILVANAVSAWKDAKLRNGVTLFLCAIYSAIAIYNTLDYKIVSFMDTLILLTIGSSVAALLIFGIGAAITHDSKKFESAEDARAYLAGVFEGEAREIKDSIYQLNSKSNGILWNTFLFVPLVACFLNGLWYRIG